MLKKIAVFRLGISELIDADALVLMPLVSDGDNPLVGTGISTGFLSLVLTDKSPAQITAAYTVVSEETRDCLPVIVWELESEAASFNFMEVDISQVKDAIEEFRKDCAKFLETGLTLDELLDIANQRGGVEKLTEGERRLLVKLSVG